jgi:hypothetical protein
MRLGTSSNPQAARRYAGGGLSYIAVTAAPRFIENPVTKLALALRKGMRMMAQDTRTNPHPQRALALSVA